MMKVKMKMKVHNTVIHLPEYSSGCCDMFCIFVALHFCCHETVVVNGGFDRVTSEAKDEVRIWVFRFLLILVRDGLNCFLRLCLIFSGMQNPFFEFEMNDCLCGVKSLIQRITSQHEMK